MDNPIPGISSQTMAPQNKIQAKSPWVYCEFKLAESVREFPPVGMVAFQVPGICKNGESFTQRWADTGDYF